MTWSKLLLRLIVTVPLGNSYAVIQTPYSHVSIKIVDPDSGRSYLWLGLSLTKLHLPVF